MERARELVGVRAPPGSDLARLQQRVLQLRRSARGSAFAAGRSTDGFCEVPPLALLASRHATLNKSALAPGMVVVGTVSRLIDGGAIIHARGTWPASAWIARAEVEAAEAAAAASASEAAREGGSRSNRRTGGSSAPRPATAASHAQLLAHMAPTLEPLPLATFALLHATSAYPKGALLCGPSGGQVPLPPWLLEGEFLVAVVLVVQPDGRALLSLREDECAPRSRVPRQEKREGWWQRAVERALWR